jgi:hypothetical protein
MHGCLDKAKQSCRTSVISAEAQLALPWKCIKGVSPQDDGFVKINMWEPVQAAVWTRRLFVESDSSTVTLWLHT